jgi:hypothetical protein
VFESTQFSLTADQLAGLQEANDALANLRARRIERVRAADSAGLATWALRSYRQLWLHRVIALAEGASSEWNARRLLNVSVLLRALVETVASFFAIAEQGASLLDAGDLRGFHARVIKAMFGIRQDRDKYPELPEAVNVLTLVDRLAKLLPNIRRYYDALCELVHPNSDGITVFGEVDHETYELLLGQDLDRDRFLVASVMGGIRMIALIPVLFGLTESNLDPQIAALETKHGPHPSTWPP